MSNQGIGTNGSQNQIFKWCYFIGLSVILAGCRAGGYDPEEVGIIVATAIVLAGVVALMVAAGISQHRAGKEQAEKDQALMHQLKSAITAGAIEDVRALAPILVGRLRQIDYGGNRQSDAIVAYGLILDSLIKYPALKPCALEVGRIRYGIGRPNGLPTSYDESAIANDISAHL